MRTAIIFFIQVISLRGVQIIIRVWIGRKMRVQSSQQATIVVEQLKRMKNYLETV